MSSEFKYFNPAATSLTGDVVERGTDPLLTVFETLLFLMLEGGRETLLTLKH